MRPLGRAFGRASPVAVVTAILIFLAAGLGACGDEPSPTPPPTDGQTADTPAPAPPAPYEVSAPATTTTGHVTLRVGTPGPIADRAAPDRLERVRFVNDRDTDGVIEVTPVGTAEDRWIVQAELPMAGRWRTELVFPNRVDAGPAILFEEAVEPAPVTVILTEPVEAYDGPGLGVRATVPPDTTLTLEATTSWLGGQWVRTLLPDGALAYLPANTLDPDIVAGLPREGFRPMASVVAAAVGKVSRPYLESGGESRSAFRRTLLRVESRSVDGGWLRVCCADEWVRYDPAALALNVDPATLPVESPTAVWAVDLRPGSDFQPELAAPDFIDPMWLGSDVAVACADGAEPEAAYLSPAGYRLLADRCGLYPSPAVDGYLARVTAERLGPDNVAFPRANLDVELVAADGAVLNRIQVSEINLGRALPWDRSIGTTSWSSDGRALLLHVVRRGDPEFASFDVAIAADGAFTSMPVNWRAELQYRAALDARRHVAHGAQRRNGGRDDNRGRAGGQLRLAA